MGRGEEAYLHLQKETKTQEGGQWFIQSLIDLSDWIRTQTKIFWSSDQRLKRRIEPLD